MQPAVTLSRGCWLQLPGWSNQNNAHTAAPTPAHATLPNSAPKILSDAGPIKQTTTVWSTSICSTLSSYTLSLTFKKPWQLYCQLCDRLCRKAQCTRRSLQQPARSPWSFCSTSPISSSVFAFPHSRGNYFERLTDYDYVTLNTAHSKRSFPAADGVPLGAFRRLRRHLCVGRIPFLSLLDAAGLTCDYIFQDGMDPYAFFETNRKKVSPSETIQPLSSPHTPISPFFLRHSMETSTPCSLEICLGILSL